MIDAYFKELQRLEKEAEEKGNEVTFSYYHLPPCTVKKHLEPTVPLFGLLTSTDMQFEWDNIPDFDWDDVKARGPNVAFAMARDIVVGIVR